MKGAGPFGRARTAVAVAASVAESQRQTLRGNYRHRWFEAAGMAAVLPERHGSCRSAPTRAGAAARFGAVSGGNGCGAAIVRASRRAAGIEVGFFASGLDQGIHRRD